MNEPNILVPLAVTATGAAWRGVPHMARAVWPSAAVVFSALITLLAAAGVALRVLRCVHCSALLRELGEPLCLWEEGIKQINFHYMVKAGRA